MSTEVAIQMRSEFVNPELFLIALCSSSDEFGVICSYFRCSKSSFIEECWLRLGTVIVPDEAGDYELLGSSQYFEMLSQAEQRVKATNGEQIDIPDIVASILTLTESNARYLLLESFTADIEKLMNVVNAAYDGSLTMQDVLAGLLADNEKPDLIASLSDNSSGDGDEYDIDDFLLGHSRRDWKSLVTCINACLSEHNPLIGREAELERTIQILCRKDKNNPLYVGEAGVGKSALIYGLAARIENGDVPERLRGAKIYQVDMGRLVAGTQYRGEFEERLKSILEGVSSEGNSIIYIDEIHTLIGSGASSDSSLDGSNILKPYLEAGQIRFIGATTYKEYNKHFYKSQGMERRFQKIDIVEPTIDEAVTILEGLREHYEKYHGVRYADGMMRYAVELSDRHITDRYLPDKAIDLIDEAGAYRELHHEGSTEPIVDREVMNMVIKKVCRLTDEMLSASEKGTEALAVLETMLLSQIFGQEHAVREVVEAVQIAKAGLSDSEKPLASLLFVGPTGVGKTELCRALAHQLGIELVRFDMSEYAEKHTVAKLIGSPAGYVGYEDGGLLTDAIRRSPNCVLLLDEIEKAHPDVYNILLQIMDYASLTDNRGNKANFKNVILVMTSNAGAQYASMASVGFGNNTTRGDAMLATVKKTFKPEFINRLSNIVVFNDMSREMARQVLQKKLNQLSQRLLKKKVTLTLSDEAMNYMLEKGYTKEYGAREMDRVISRELNPLLIKEILFGSLKNGGEARVVCETGGLKLGEV